MAYNSDSDTIKHHRAAILAVAVTQAEAKGYTRITRAEIAAEAGVSVGVVNAAYGTMLQLKRDVVRHAVKHNLIGIIAEALAHRDPQALKATPEQKAAAFAHLTQ